MIVTSKTGEYRLLGKIGNGAVGVVRKAEDRVTGRIVAIKFLAPDPKYIDVEKFDDVAERFRREGQRGEHLTHDRLVRMHCFEENRGGQSFRDRQIKNPFLVMEYIRGKTLESAVRALGDPERPGVHIDRPTLSVGQAICDALSHLDRSQLVHRDVKPANIFLSAGRLGITPAQIKLGDFGVTKWGDFVSIATAGSFTMSSQRGLGTQKYMSPEQALKPKDVTVRADMFSFGITLFELFTGRILPSTHHVFEIMSARRQRGSITGKLTELEVRGATPFEEGVFEKVLDLFAQSPKDRPSSHDLLGRFGYWLGRLDEARAV